MKFKLDENLPERVRIVLRGLRHDAHSVAEECLAGATDSTVLEACIAEDRVLITLDLDYSDIRSYPPGTYPGIGVLRPSAQTFKAIESLVLAAVSLSSSEWMPGQLWVVDEQRVRIRNSRF